MYWRDILYLISITTTTNEIGDTIETETKKQIFANKMAYRTKAVTQALANGLRPEYSFELKEADYSGEKRIEYNSTEYEVIDMAPSKNECVEILCRGVV